MISCIETAADARAQAYSLSTGMFVNGLTAAQFLGRPPQSKKPESPHDREYREQVTRLFQQGVVADYAHLGALLEAIEALARLEAIEALARLEVAP